MLVDANPCNKPGKDFHGGNTGSIPVRDATPLQLLTDTVTGRAFAAVTLW